MIARQRKGGFGRWIGLLLTALLALPALYLVAALAGSVISVNHDWREAFDGTTIYIADNGIHADIIMPVDSNGLNWTTLFPKHDFAQLPAGTPWIAFGSGEREIYLDTPQWSDIRLSTLWPALAGGARLVHVEYVSNPDYAVRQIRLRPEEYRHLWAAIRADFASDVNGRPERDKHPGYGPSDAFYSATGKASAIRTCNVVVADWLRLAGVKASLWPPLSPGLIWRYRKT